MPENQIPATQPEPGGAPGEFDFAKPPAENPRIRRRSLKPKSANLTKVSSNLPASRELAGDVSSSGGQPQKPLRREVEEPKVAPTVNASPAPAPASATAPAATATKPSTPAASSPAAKTSAASANPAASPHGTRPATLYYSSQPRTAETPSPMKTIPTASPSSATTLPTSIPRTAAASPRSTSPVDYRANVERQSREQKSVGSILSYVVYGLIGLFLISAGLAIYGADVIFKQLHNQSMTVTDLDQRYAAANKDLNAKLAATQDTLGQAQAQITRQQDLILKQQEELNRLIAVTNDEAGALKQEKQSRTQEAAALRARVRDLEYKTTTQKY